MFWCGLSLSRWACFQKPFMAVFDEPTTPISISWPSFNKSLLILPIQLGISDADLA